MGLYQIRITLLSDLCSSNGGIYNASVDTEICYDHAGIPFIPGKRLKGCLRECADELTDWGIRIQTDRIFGKEGSEKANLQIRNAFPEGYPDIVRELEDAKGSVLAHPINVLKNYTHLRQQTAIDQETGTAEDASLRTIRVVNKGLVFLCDISLDEAYVDEFRTILSTFRHMGAARTRGFGEIRAELVEKPSDRSDAGDGKIERDENASFLPYSMELLEPTVIKSVQGQESRSLDYLDASKVLGCIAERLRKSGDFPEILNKGEMKISNAYLSEGGRLEEVPAVYRSVKNCKTEYRNCLYPNPDANDREKTEQVGVMKHCYVRTDKDGRLHKYTVSMEEHYHHRRPADKAIGKPTGEESSDGGVFYQISAITEGQTFSGFIEGTPEQIEMICKNMRNDEVFYIGAGSSSEYGKCRLHFGKAVKRQEKHVFTDHFAVFLNAPAILYQDRAFYSTNLDDLRKEVLLTLGIGEDLLSDRSEGCKIYAKNTVVGGYQTKWHMRKPTVAAFDKGTTLVFKLNKKAPVLEGPFFIGERVLEGYGECRAEALDSDGKYKCEIAQDEKSTGTDRLKVEEKGILRQTADRLFMEYVDSQAAQNAKKLFEKKEMRNGASTVSNMILMCEGCTSLDAVEKECNERFDRELKKGKLQIAEMIMDDAKNRGAELETAFARRYHLVEYHFSGEPDAKYQYLRSSLTQLKYLLRQEKAEEGVS